MNLAPGSTGDSSAHFDAAESGFPATVYVAVYLPADTMPGGLAKIQMSLAEAARKVTDAGRPVRYLNGMYMPAQTRLLCVFAAQSEEAVHAAMELVRLPFVQIRAITDG